MELRHLITFKTIVEKGGFKRAAEYLDYSQSSVTVHVKELEKELKKPLFDRIGRKVFLTNYGTQFHPYAVKIVDLYNEAAETMNMNDAPKGCLVIGVTEIFSQYRIPSILMEYKKRYPDVSLSLRSLENKEISAALKNGQIDMAFVLERNVWFDKELTIEKIKDESIVLVRPVCPEDSENTILSTEESCSYKSMLEAYIQEEQIEAKNTLNFSSLEAIKQCVLSGLGFSILPYFAVEKELASEQILGEFISLNHTGNATFIVNHKNKQLSPAMQAMISLMKEQSLHWGE
ncbi:LysR family transcriptional regulator [Oceanobacillus oncorhynchi subsp. incaldanensis]|uniref:HTH-type transcriptional regulator GltR n=1 Tax=Oceanobacillus oncorhynchi TaxID=545501 RepID=A0A0A1ME51_9BACI|nr:LysR family transcriptional regulator [Oceanobacillus oncorhynchi]GIO17297.1 LysR family transcriptional regulator [Oceanobacillus oncorhynchi subsp. incaldanensis]CEI83655.1 HTH-type transcriptional regulator GltR [Oceanobacillus oncorhynchi]